MMTTELPSVIPLMPRFHRQDVCAVVSPDSISIIARDVVSALSLPIDSYDAEPSHDVSFAQHATATTWTPEMVTDILRPIEDRADVAEFLTWLSERVVALDLWGSANLHRQTAAPSWPVAAVEHVQPPQFSVAEAARLLSRDPTISIGQTALFEWMHSTGWISKSRDRVTTWKPKRELLFIGYLAVLDNSIPAHRDPYPQICITTPGMHALHERLGGTAALNLEPALDTPLLKD
jgi:hypothetical protein